MRKLLLLLFALPAFATVTATVSNVTHATAYFTITPIPPCYQVEFGQVSGALVGTSAMSCQGAADTGKTYVTVAVSGYTPSIKYYFRVCSYDTGTDMSPTECSTEDNFTTSAEPDPHPMIAIEPTVWTPPDVDASAYTVVPMKCDVGDSYIPLVASNVSAPMNWRAGSLSTNDTLTDVLATINVGTTVQFPQGATCKFYEQEMIFHTGYLLPEISDDMSGRYIVFETVQNADTDFPPYGVRTGPEWASRMAKLLAVTPEMQASGQQNIGGQLFHTYDQTVHHMVWRNLEMSNSTEFYTTPLDIDPYVFSSSIGILPSSKHPHHLIFDRIYVHTAAYPSRQWVGLAIGGDHISITGIYNDPNMFFMLQDIPFAPATISMGTITIPTEQFNFNHFTTLYGSTTPTTISASGTGTMSVWIDAATPGTNGLTCRYNGITSVIVGGGGCTTSSGSETPPSTALRILQFSWTSGTPTISFQVPWNTVNIANADWTTRYQQWKPIVIYHLSGSDWLVDNNYLMTEGQGLYEDADLNGSAYAEDRLYTHNYFEFPLSKIMSQPSWDGYRYNYRNSVEMKQGHRFAFVGNIWSGGSSIAGTNDGSPWYPASAYPGTGIGDWRLVNNTLRHITTGITCAGGGTFGPPDGQTMFRVYVHNNIFQDVDTYKYNAYSGQALYTGGLSIKPGCTDFIYDHNSMVGLGGRGPALMYFGESSNGVSVLMEGFKYTNNIASFGKAASAGAPAWCQGGQIKPDHPANPTTNCVATDGSFGTNLDSYSIRWVDAGPTPNYNFTGNYILGWKKCTADCLDTSPTLVDLDATEIATYMTGFPASNVTVAGATIAARLATIGWDDTTYSCSLCGTAGADVTLLPPAQGIVTNIAVSSGPTAISATYTAPDTRQCYLEVSDDSFVTLTRASDGGGATSRTATVSGLASLTAYDWRLQCYFQQTTAHEFSGTQLTSGSITTESASGTGSRISGKVSFSGKTR